MNRHRILVIAALPDSLVNFRLQLLHAMVEAGHCVLACAAASDPLSGLSSSDVARGLERIGVQYRQFPLQRTGLNPLQDLRSMISLYRLLRRLQPEVVLSYTMKAVIYGSIAARFAHIPKVYSMITGLGNGMPLHGNCAKSRLSRSLYRAGLSGNAGVFFQNPDDLAAFVDLGLVKDISRTILVNGSGVDLSYYAAAEPIVAGPSFLLIARLLRDKGILEYAAAARELKKQYPYARFRLLGPLDKHPCSISRSELRQWQEDGSIEYLGPQSDVRPALSKASVYVLPSYHEGTPRTVLEAMSMGRPVVSTNTPGCRETVIPGENGFLVAVRDANALARAMEQFILHPELIPKMGARSRQIAEEKYDVKKVNALMLRYMGLI